MDTSLLNLKLIQERLSHIRASANRLKRFRALSREQFLADPDNYAIAEHHLRRSLEAILDIGRHIIAKKGLGKPGDYRGILLSLGQGGIIPFDFALKIQGMAGYRNRLVHDYAGVSATEIYDLLLHFLDDLTEFTQHILHLVQEELGKKK
ncbi:MAG: type VII toxin-antitoxin system HepT family RNase toxin [Bacillota bacterium]